jgi:hypothetical protein
MCDGCRSLEDQQEKEFRKGRAERPAFLIPLSDSGFCFGREIARHF